MRSWEAPSRTPESVSSPGHLYRENLFHKLFQNSSVVLEPVTLLICSRLLPESTQSKVTVLICMCTVCPH